MIADNIKILRQQRGMTQSELARKLKITRSSVNAWEMGISVPSTQYIAELALLFNVSSDYLLGIAKSSTISVDGLSDTEIAAVTTLVECLKNKNNPAD